MPDHQLISLDAALRSVLESGPRIKRMEQSLARLESLVAKLGQSPVDGLLVDSRRACELLGGVSRTWLMDLSGIPRVKCGTRVKFGVETLRQWIEANEAEKEPEPAGAGAG